MGAHYFPTTMTTPRLNPKDFDTITKIKAVPARHRKAVAQHMVPYYRRKATRAHNRAVKARNAMFSPTVLAETYEERAKRLAKSIAIVERHPEWITDEVRYRLDRMSTMSPQWQRLTLWAEDYGYLEPLQYSFKLTAWLQRHPERKGAIALNDALKESALQHAALESCKRIAAGMTEAQWEQARRLDRAKRQAETHGGKIKQDAVIRLYIAMYNGNAGGVTA